MLRWFHPESLRARLLGVVFICLALPLAGAVYYLQRDFDHKLAAAQDLTERLAEIGVRRHDELIGQARNLLYVLAQVPGIRDAKPGALDECVGILKSLTDRAEWISSAWLTDAGGTMLCHEFGPLPGFNLGDREYFKRLTVSKSFELSGYLIGKRSGKQVVVAAQPVLQEGRLRGVLGVSIELEWYNELNKISRDPKTTVLVVDDHGVVLGHQPDLGTWIGRQMGSHPDIQRVLQQPSGKMVTSRIDGIERVWSFRPLGATGVKFLVGLSTEPLQAAARRDFQVGLGMLAAAGLLGFLAIWWLVRASILKWLQLLIDGASRVGAGDTGLILAAQQAPREIALVTTAFNEMVSRLKARDYDLTLARQTAEDASERLTAVLESTSDNILAVGRDWVVAYANNRARSQLPGPGRLVGEDLWQAFPGARGSNFERQLRRAMGERVPVACTEFFAAQNTWYEVNAYPSADGIAVYFRDVTLRKRADQALRDAKEQAESANRSKSDFLAAVSHEIRTPLNGLVGFADMLLETPLNDDQKGYSTHIRDAGRALVNVIDDVFDYARLEAGRLELHHTALDLATLVNGCTDIVGAAAAAKSLTLSVQLAPGVPARVLGDADRVRQILLNLLTNAVKFTDYGRIDLLVEPGPGGRTVFTITDTGVGIPEERQRELFQRFNQIDRSRGGTGLGLAICRRLVELMGGSVGVRSRAGAGSTFWFAIPLPPAPDGDVLSAPVRAPALLPRDGGPYRVLVVEDVAMNRELVAAMLRNAGYMVEMAVDGAAAVAAVHRSPVDLVLMDIEMPGMDGLEASRAIRALPGAAATVPIIALTAVIQPSDVDRCTDAGMNGYLSKPIEREELLEAVFRTLSLAEPPLPARPVHKPADGAVADA